MTNMLRDLQVRNCSYAIKLAIRAFGTTLSTSSEGPGRRLDREEN